MNILKNCISHVHDTFGTRAVSVAVLLLTVHSVVINRGTVIAQDAQTPLEQAASETDPPTKTFVGRVVDRQGNPIAGATVMLDDRRSLMTQMPNNHVTLSDDQGRFQITILRDSETMQKQLFFSHYMWAYKKGYCVRCVATQYRDELEMVLPDEETVTFKVTHPTIILFGDEIAAPYYFDTPNGCYTSDESTGLSGPIPQDLRKMLAEKLLPDGTVVIRGVTKALLNSAWIESPRLGTQYGPPVGTLALRETGSLTISLRCPLEALPPEALPPEAKPTEASPESTDLVVHIDDGRANQSGVVHWDKLDKNLQVSIPTIGAGQAEVSLSWPNDSDFIPLTPRDFTIRPGEDNQLEIKTIEAIEVHGRVFASDTGQPVTRTRISFRSEDVNFRRSATTDKDGFFSVRMPRGGLRVQIFAMPINQTHQYPGSFTVNVPDDVKRFELEPIAVDPKGTVRGFLIDEDGNRVPSRHVILLSQPYRHSRARAVTDERGSFVLRLGDYSLQQFKNSLAPAQRALRPKPKDIELKVLPEDAPADPVTLSDYIKNSQEESPYKIMSTQPLVLKLVSEKPDP